MTAGKLNAFRDFGGLRLEDDFVITPDSARKLGAPLTKTVAEIEAIRKSWARTQRMRWLRAWNMEFMPKLKTTSPY